MPTCKKCKVSPGNEKYCGYCPECYILELEKKIDSFKPVLDLTNSTTPDGVIFSINQLRECRDKISKEIRDTNANLVIKLNDNAALCEKKLAERDAKLADAREKTREIASERELFRMRLIDVKNALRMELSTARGINAGFVERLGGILRMLNIDKEKIWEITTCSLCGDDVIKTRMFACSDDLCVDCYGELAEETFRYRYNKIKFLVQLCTVIFKQTEFLRDKLAAVQVELDKLTLLNEKLIETNAYWYEKRVEAITIINDIRMLDNLCVGKRHVDSWEGERHVADITEPIIDEDYVADFIIELRGKIDKMEQKLRGDSDKQPDEQLFNLRLVSETSDNIIKATNMKLINQDGNNLVYMKMHNDGE